MQAPHHVAQRKVGRALPGQPGHVDESTAHALGPAGRVASRCISPYSTWLQTKVPAVCDTSQGTPARCTPRSMALTGRLAKYAAGPPGITGVSTGWAPMLSGMRASLTLMPTRSMESAARPPAWPRHTTRAGLCASISAPKWCSDRPNTVGNCTDTTLCPPMRWPSSAWAMSQLGFSASPPKGSNPVSRITGSAGGA